MGLLTPLCPCQFMKEVIAQVLPVLLQLNVALGHLLAQLLKQAIDVFMLRQHGFNKIARILVLFLVGDIFLVYSRCLLFVARLFGGCNNHIVHQRGGLKALVHPYMYSFVFTSHEVDSLALEKVYAMVEKLQMKEEKQRHVQEVNLLS